MSNQIAGYCEPKEKNFLRSAELAVKRFYRMQLDPMIAVRKVRRWYYSDQFSPKGEGADSMTRWRIRDRFDGEFRRTHDSTFMEPMFQKVAYYFVSARIPAFQRTRKALEESAANRHALEVMMHGFIRGIQSGRFGWRYHKTADGFEQLEFRDGGEWHALETTNAHVPLQKESEAFRFARLMKKLFE